MEERRLLLAVALSFLVLTGYRLLFPSPARPRAERPAPAASARPATESVSPPAAPSPAGVSSRPVSPQPASAASAPSVSDDKERRVEVSAARETVAFSNRGARLVSWKLLGSQDDRGAPLEMVRASASGPWPLDLETGDPILDARLRSALFRPSSTELHVQKGHEGVLSFQFSEGDLEARKELAFRGDGLVAVRASVRREGRDWPLKLLWGPGLGNPTAAEQAVSGYTPPQGVSREGRVERHLAKDLASPHRLSTAEWVGVETQYFVALLVAPGGRGAGEVRRMDFTAEDGTPQPLPIAALELQAGEAPALLYVGAKDHDTLAALGHNLHDVVPIGDWLGPIVVPLLKLLRFVHGYVGNYGWAIVVLTLVINLVMAPLRHLSIANGLKMAKMAPEMKVIQERYRKIPPLDPRRQDMHQEMSALYEKHGMSMGTQMMLGCLPLLLTMPFLFAFYRVLQVSVDLRGAPFLWIPDLSHRDPLFVTPVLMGLSMILMQKLTPSAMDPAQQRIMMLMPLVLVVMFFAAPAGLNLYWLASNVCAIAQQGVTLSLLRREEPARERKRK